MTVALKNMRTCTFSLPLMTKSYRRTRQCVFLETLLWRKKTKKTTTTPVSLHSWRKAADGGALIHSIQLNLFFQHKLLTTELEAARHVFIMNGVISLTLPPLLAVRNTEPVLNLQSPGDRATPSAGFIYVESRSAASLLYLSPPLQSSPLPTSLPTHIRTHTGGGAQHHSGACARPLRALQRHYRCMVASRHWTIPANYYPNRHAHSSLAL